jgi:serine/threonine protein phosphatase PrpC
MEATTIESDESRAIAAGERPPLRVLTHGLTDTGQVRPANEDQFAIAEVRRVLRVRQSSFNQPEVLLGDELGHLLVVADGMGGHRGGEVASTMAVVGIESLLLNTIGWLFRLKGDSVLKELRETLKTTDRWVGDAANEKAELRGMGTTVTMAYVTGNTLYIAHAGDSRCYLWRDGKLSRLTRDHTLVESLPISAEEAAHHNMRHVVLNAVGGGTPGVDPEVHKHAVQPGDRFLLCTDGLTETVADDVIEAILGAEAMPSSACQRLIAEANAGGGPDNITAVVVSFSEAAH